MLRSLVGSEMCIRDSPFFKELNDNVFQINEFRFFCHKPSHGRTLHFASTSSSDSKEWVEYLVGIRNIFGLSCKPNCVDVFRRLEGDNSFLAQYNRVDIFYAEYYRSTEKVYEHQMYIPFKFHFNVIDFPNDKPRRFECDDFVSSAGVWQVYIR